MLLHYCDHEPLPLPAGHKFPLEKYRMLRDRLASDARFQFAPAPLVETAAIERVHSAAYVRGVLDGSLTPEVFRRIGFPWSQQMVRRTLCSAGATLAATAEAQRTGFGGALAGGTHHAAYAEGSGFCVFNDIAIAIRANRHRRTAVIDLDVHQGDGTASLFAEDASVFTLSMHGENNFPLRKQQSSRDIALPDGTGDDEYLDALARVLPEIAGFLPDAVYYQSGVDALAQDKLGLLSLSLEGLRERDKLVFTFCAKRNIPVTTVLGGGYSDPIAWTVTAHEQTFRTALEVFG